MTRKLLIQLRDQIKDKMFLSSGLCWEIYKLFKEGKISFQEYNELEDFIHQNRPKKGKHFDPSMSIHLHFWPAGDVKPRLDWLNYKIKYFKS